MKTNVLKKLPAIFKQLKRYVVILVGGMKRINPYLKPVFQKMIKGMKHFGFYLKPLFQRFSELPPKVPPRNYRFFVLSNYAYFFAFIGNAGALFLSALIGAWYITLFCLGSVLFFALAIRLNLWGYLRVSLPFVILQALALVILIAYMVGNIGVNALLIPLAMFIFLSPLEHKIINVIVSIAIGAAYAAVNYYVRNFTPLIVLSPIILKILNFIAGCTTIAAACFIGYYYRVAAVRAEAALEQEYKRAENLLHNILPETIANRLKLNPDSIADGFDGTSILFADIVGFTPISAQMPPENTVMLLNEVFSDFDDLVDKYKLEKIKTIGDAYMAVAGLPEPRADHAEAIAEMALDMMQVMARFDVKIGNPLKIRIGINSGPAVAGVIGKKKFIYDLWGDTVNTASRMESHGLAGEIQVSPATHELLKDKYHFQERGVIEIKGKGPMQTYLLKGRKSGVLE
jgi:adenylate cyclase